MLIFILLRLRTKNPENKNKHLLLPSENIIMGMANSYISNIKAENIINEKITLNVLNIIFIES